MQCEYVGHVLNVRFGLIDRSAHYDKTKGTRCVSVIRMKCVTPYISRSCVLNGH